MHKHYRGLAAASKVLAGKCSLSWLNSINPKKQNEGLNISILKRYSKEPGKLYKHSKSLKSNLQVCCPLYILSNHPHQNTAQEPDFLK